MALSVNQTKELIRSEKNLNPNVSSILFENEGGSQTGSGNLWAYLHALASNLLSQLTDVFIVEVNTIVFTNTPATKQWIKAKMLAYQDGDILVEDPVTFNAYYPIISIDPAKRIITQCSVTSDIEGVVTIKLATGGNVPAPLTSGQVNSAFAYYDEFNPAGITFNIISLPSDKLYVKAVIFYNGQYSSVIKTTVIAAMTNFLAAIPFDGTFIISDFETSIKTVAGVRDVVFESIWARSDATYIGSATKLIDEYFLTAVSNRKWPTVSGYMVPETTSGSQFSDTLTFTIDG